MAACVAACVVAMGSITAVAAYRYLSPKEVAAELEDKKLEQAFLSEDAVFVNETQESGGYRITLLGSVAGKNISDYLSKDESNKVNEDKIYTVVGGPYEVAATQVGVCAALRCRGREVKSITQERANILNLHLLLLGVEVTHTHNWHIARHLLNLGYVHLARIGTCLVQTPVEVRVEEAELLARRLIAKLAPMA